MSKKNIYKVIFHNEGKIYEIYAKNIHQGGLLGFVELEELLLEERDSIVIDPAEEELQDKFKDIVRTYIPMHAIIRIDEVNKRGVAKILENPDGNIMPFPIYTDSPTDKAGT